MEYRYYRGDGPRIPLKVRRFLHRLRPLGVLFLVGGILIPLLILIKVLPSTYFINFLAFALLLLGPIFYLVGMVFDNYIDRAE